MLRFISALGVACIALTSYGLGHVAQQPEAAKPEYFTAHVKPIFDANCARCHGGMNHRGGLNMGTRELMLKGGHHGPGVVPGDTANSWIIKLIRHEGPKDDPMEMPRKGEKLSDSDIAIVEQWVKAGAVMPLVLRP